MTSSQKTRTPANAKGDRRDVIPAGVDDKRLLPLTRRLGRILNPERTKTVITWTHEPFDAGKHPVRSGALLVQPAQRGTTPEIVYSLLGLYEIDPHAVVGFFLSDHHFAEENGALVGDVILGVAGQRIDNSRDLQLRIGNPGPSTAVKLSVLRDGTARSISVNPGKMPTGAAQEVRSRSAEVARGYEVRSCKRREPRERGSGAGLQQGDVIQQVNRQPVTSVAGFGQARRTAGDRPILLPINRNGATSFIVVQPH